MDLDEMKSQWVAFDQKLGAVLNVQSGVARRQLAERAALPLRAQGWQITLEQGINIAGVVLVGLFIAGHYAQPRFLLPALVLDAALAALIVASVLQRRALNSVDFSDAILTTQKRLAALQAQRVRYTQAVLLLAPLLWVPLLIVLMKGLFGVDAYALFGAAWLSANVLLGLIWIPLAIWGARWMAQRAGQSAGMRRLLDDVGGRNLNEARKTLATLAEIERDVV